VWDPIYSGAFPERFAGIKSGLLAIIVLSPSDSIM